MIKLGTVNRLKVVRKVDFGLYLSDDEGNEVLLPARYVDNRTMRQDQSIGVFVYNDSEDRPVATTDRPVAMVNEVAFLPCVSTNRFGAFLDWGLMKDLLVPFSEQKVAMRAGRSYPVFIYLDHASGRIVGSAKLEKFLGNVYPRCKAGDKVSALILHKSPLGYVCAVDNLYRGMIYDNQSFAPLRPGMKIDAWVRQIRPDGKLDLLVRQPRSGRERTERLADELLEAITLAGGQLPVNDKSNPEEIKARFHCSKRDFKQAVGHLLKAGKIAQNEQGLALLASQ
ncbi:MAG: S1-like domain-containing RNA-binding protein [Bacteroides sp.]|nr:S1-like domain-containing RNA-binding protein [Bacteroides sp.]MCM1413421.1 S1-like domain-containing RNA-binding protein [Bacteroides sp.]MCM1471368.1 S1-like domain-containing RNA-binding protein [Bacteroides sp.]